MKKHTFLMASVLGMSICSQGYAQVDEAALAAANNYIQAIHVVNVLANADLADPGMTPTAIEIKYYIGSNKCWSYVLNYHEDYSVHAGPGLGCSTKVDRVVVTPIAVATRLNTYSTPADFSIDTSKYSVDIVVTQETAPAFDAQSGLVTTPGSVKLQAQGSVLP